MKRLRSILCLFLFAVAAVTWWQTPAGHPACPDATPGYDCGKTEVPKGTVLLLHFDPDHEDWDFLVDCSGATYSPHSPDANTSWGGIGGSPDISTDSAFFAGSGVSPGSGVSMDGTNDFYIFSPDRDFNIRLRDFWFECYAKMATGSNITQVIWGNTGGSPDHLVGTNNGNMALYNGTNGWFESAVDLRDAKWHHLAYGRSGTTCLLFVDGEKIYANAGLTDDMANINQRFGLGWNGSNHKFNGDMDEVLHIIGDCLYTEDFRPRLYPSGTTPTVIDSYDVLVIHSNHYQGSQVFTDDSDSGHTVTASGDVHHDLDGRKFLLSGVSFDNTNDHLEVIDHDDWDFGSGDFTIELWHYRQATGQKALINNWTSGALPYSGGWSLEYNTSNRINFYWDYGPNLHQITGTVGYLSGSWNHIAISKSGSTIYLFGNGTLETEQAFTDTIDPSAHALWIGEYSGIARDLMGYMQSIRISKGIGRYTENFTPRERAF